MYNNELFRKINRRKELINFLLLFLPPTNALMVMLSKNLDKLITKYQANLYKKYSDPRSMMGYYEMTA